MSSTEIVSQRMTKSENHVESDLLWQCVVSRIGEVTCYGTPAEPDEEEKENANLRCPNPTSLSRDMVCDRTRQYKTRQDVESRQLPAVMLLYSLLGLAWTLTI